MRKPTRRRFAKTVALAAAAASPPAAGAQEHEYSDLCTRTVSLDGEWLFRLDPNDEGKAAGWMRSAPGGDWRTVIVPHTWNVEPENAGYHGAAWYQREIAVPRDWQGASVRVRFGAVYHTAEVWLNGEPVGVHERLGYTAFFCDLTPAIRFGEPNLLAVRVDNSFRDDMLPRGRSFDWAADGGIIRPVSLHLTPRVFLERFEIEAEPIDGNRRARIRVRVFARNDSGRPVRIQVHCRAVEEASGREAARVPPSPPILTPSGISQTIDLEPAVFDNPRLWHFDHPHLYRLEARLTVDGRPGHSASEIFGIRKIEVRGAAFYLNGERVWLAGVERMAGSHPEHGMAETGAWIRHDHDDMKKLNCIFTRVHWPQDERVLDYCDRHGIFIQLEVPAWGRRTFRDLTPELEKAIAENAADHMREMIDQNRNHPSVFSWGLANEIGGQDPAAQKFVRGLFTRARLQDPTRPLTYASNSLQRDPENDVAGQMDFIMWNEYYESWMRGDVPAMERNLKAIHDAFPGKPVVISEYGYCECRPAHSGGDPKRIDILKRHTAVFRKYDWVAGAIFFDYNDYRTHMGDKGAGPLKQRVHGVVDLYGNPKPSYAELRRELSPIETLEAEAGGGQVRVRLTVRKRLPGYALRGYTLRWIVFGFGGLPMQMGAVALGDLAAGAEKTVTVAYDPKGAKRIQIDVLRPTGFSVRRMLAPL